MQPTRAQHEIPTVSVIMANYRGGATLERALESVLAQTMADLEVIVADDASPDDSVAVITTFMARDSRVRLIASPHNGGPAKTRNLALAEARGRWIAIIDSDDIVHPERLERLLAAAAHFKADIVADDLLHFHEDGTAPTLLLAGRDTPYAVTPEAWITAGLDGVSPSLGYLKPLIRSEALGGLRYDETLRIGEDYDLLLRVLLAGAAMTIVPEPWYLYRRHSGSISHRLSIGDVEAMLANQARLIVGLKPSAPIAAAFERRRDRLQSGLEFERLVAAIKGRKLGDAARIISRRPELLAGLWRSFNEGCQRRAATAPTAARAIGSYDLAADTALPPYRSVADIDWASFKRGQHWLELAERGLRAKAIHVEGSAARYAAGFIPRAISPAPAAVSHPAPEPAVAT